MLALMVVGSGNNVVGLRFAACLMATRDERLLQNSVFEQREVQFLVIPA
jgi:hypothetical protein